MRHLNGEPGYVSADGHVKYLNPNNGNKEEAIASATVNVNFSKYENGSWQYKWTVQAQSNAAGRYEVLNKSVGVGKWRIKGVLPQFGSYFSSESNWHEFVIKSGYRLRPRHSEKCASISGNGKANGTAVIQWTCSAAPNPQDGQVFTLVPVGSNFNIVANSSGKCVDVAGVSTANGAKLHQWDCLGAGQTNQVWQRVAINGHPPWLAFIAQHSGRCMDVEGAAQANGAKVHQWDCHWSGQQQWRMEEVN